MIVLHVAGVSASALLFFIVWMRSSEGSHASLVPRRQTEAIDGEFVTVPG